MEFNLLQNLTRLITVILVISIFLVIKSWKQLPGSFKVLGCYFIWNLITEAVVLSLPSGTNNLPLLHLYTLVEFILFALVYREIGLFNRWRKGFFPAFFFGVICLVILNSLFLQEITSYNSYAKTLVQVCLIGFALAYLFEFREKTTEIAGFSYVNSAVLLYYSASVFVFMFGNILLGNKYNGTFWLINSILNLVFQILNLIGVWTVSKGKKFQSS